MYEAFAEIYDRLMDDVDYGAWAAFYQELLGRCGLTGGEVCECACGTGNLTIPLAKAGWRMTGADISREMLEIAGEKARAAGVRAAFVQQNMCELRLPHPVDAVLATCDGVNYLLKGPELTAFFRSAWEALKPGGCLIFDVSTPWKLTQELGDRLLGADEENYSYLWQNHYYPRRRCVEMELVIFVREQDGRYRRVEEFQRQRAWEWEELFEHVKKAGFTRIECFGDRRLAPPRRNEPRWHITAVKAEGGSANG